MISLLAVLAGLVVVTVGAEVLIRGAKQGAAQLGLTPLVVGLTVVAFGTSAPEVSLGLFAVADGQGALAVGNMVGSNIFNILFIIGASALITPLVVAQKLVHYDVPILIAASIAVIVMSTDGALGGVDGGILLIALIAYVVFTIGQSRNESAAVKAEYAAEFSASPSCSHRASLWRNAILVLVGLVLLTVGARILVMGAAGLAREIGLSELVIGLTILAAGTSVPEVATSLVAAPASARNLWCYLGW
ncbi:MAG: sodium:calcium antiporter [Proteobacteria bacterium]|nr:sodium:calcium antiporter [Pseudomonadota bacterium]